VPKSSPIKATVSNIRRLEQQLGQSLHNAGIVAYSPRTGETFSACAGDYFAADPDAILKDSRRGHCVLARRRPESFEPITD
jgi:hypothetical protein